MLALDVVIEIDAHQAPLSKLVILGRQRAQSWSLEGLEEFTTANAEAPHHPVIDTIECGRYCRIAFGQGEKRLMAKASEDVSLRKMDTCFVPEYHSGGAGTFLLKNHTELDPTRNFCGWPLRLLHTFRVEAEELKLRFLRVKGCFSASDMRIGVEFATVTAM